MKLLGEDMYWVTITKKPKKVTVDGVAVEPGQGSARTTFLMRWSGNRFEFVR